MPRSLLPIFALLLLAGCSQPLTLESKSPRVPAGVDLSGQWQLRDESADTMRQILEDERRAVGGGRIKDIRRASSSKKGTLLHVFLETGTRLKITQTDSGLFISFDRAIVEEYRFGENRGINVGPVVAIRASGWEDGGYVVETLSEKGNRLVERYRIEDGGGMLLRQISIFSKDELRLSVVQKFDRV